MSDEIMVMSEACDFLKISDPTMRKMVRAGEVPYAKVGGNYRFLKSELMKWLKEQSDASQVRN